MDKMVNVGFDASHVIAEEELPRFGISHGPCVKLVCTGEHTVENYDPSMPTKLCAELVATFEDSSVVTIQTRLCSVLFFGLATGVEPDGVETAVSDSRILAVIGQAAADLKEFSEGEVTLPDAATAAETMARLNIPAQPLSQRDGIEDAWMDVWKKSGLLVKMPGDQWLIDAAIAPEFQKYKVSRYVDGRETYFLGKTEYVEMCNGEIKKTTDLTEGDVVWLADESESPINCGWVDDATVRALYEAQQAAKADGKPIPKFTQDN